MTVFEKINNKNVDELTEWFDKHCNFDFAPGSPAAFCQNQTHQYRQRQSSRSLPHQTLIIIIAISWQAHVGARSSCWFLSCFRCC